MDIPFEFFCQQREKKNGPSSNREATIFFLFVGCSNDLGLINREDVEEIRGGKDLDNKALKTALALINLCGNMKDVRYEPTMAAISFIRSITNDEYNVNNTLRKKSKYTTTSTENSSGGNDKEEGEIIEEPKKKMRLESEEVINKKTSITKHELTSTVNVPKNFDLDDFVSVLVDDDDDDFSSQSSKSGGIEPRIRNF